MRQPYETPEITELGSLTELTQANFFGPNSDNLFILRGPEVDNYS
jgi:hypothetical protein